MRTKGNQSLLGVSVLMAVCIGLTTCSKKKSNDEQPTNPFLLTDEETAGIDHQLPFRSLSEVNQILRSRMVEEQDFDLINGLVRFDDGLFNSLIGAPAKKEVAGLMGAYQGLGLRVATESLRPSTVHALLWGLAIQDFARDVAKACDGKPELFTLKTEIATAVQKICSSDELTQVDIKNLWNLILRRDVNEDEFVLWYGEEQAPLSQVKGAERVTLAVHEMLFGPEFLIGR